MNTGRENLESMISHNAKAFIALEWLDAEYDGLRRRLNTAMLTLSVFSDEPEDIVDMRKRLREIMRSRKLVEAIIKSKELERAQSDGALRNEYVMRYLALKEEYGGREELSTFYQTYGSDADMFYKNGGQPKESIS